MNEIGDRGMSALGRCLHRNIAGTIITVTRNRWESGGSGKRDFDEGGGLLVLRCKKEPYDIASFVAVHML
jgi:hypothetical protein